MINKWIAKTKDGVLEFNSVKVCTESEFNKLTAGVNRQKLISWCDDNHISFEAQRGEQYMSIIREVVQEINESEARNIDILHDKFLAFVDTLPEVDIPNKNDNPENMDTVEKCLHFAKEAIAGIDKGDIDGAVFISSIGPIGLPCGHISASILRELLTLYIDKYEHKEN
jgi:hypothetical protein